MSEERIIRINKVLRELNISLERAVDYLKDKGISIDANPNTKISDDVYNVLCGQFAGDKGKKEASKEVGEEKRKEKEALRVERENEMEDKRKQEEAERLKQQEVIKARAVLSGPVQVGKIDLSPKRKSAAPIVAQPVVEAKPAAVIPPTESKETEPVKLVSDNKESIPAKPVVEEEIKKIVKPIEVPTPVEPVAAPVSEPVQSEVEAVKTADTPQVEDAIATQYQKLSGAKLTGQTIDLSQFNKPKKKKEEPKITPNKPGAPGAANKNKRKRIAPKPGANPNVNATAKLE